MKPGLVRILDGNIFVLSQDSGDIETAQGDPSGFFTLDTRCLSLWRLSVNGERLHSLALDDSQYFEVRFFLVPGAPTHYVDAKASVIRERTVAGSFEERLTVFNHSNEPTTFTIRVEADSDFLPLWAVAEGGRYKRLGRIYKRVADGCLRLGYERDTFRRETVISTSEPARVDEDGLTYDIRIGPHGQWTTTLHVRGLALRPDGEDVRDHLHPAPHRRNKPQLEQDLKQWLAETPQLSCDWTPLEQTYRRSLVDLAALRFYTLALPSEPMPAAGLPWAATATGRDSILTSLQALPIVPDQAVATLRLLALDQAAVLDDFRDEEPGKIMHEFRYSELSAFEEQPDTPYFGSADATPLFVILLDEYERWSGNADLVHEFEAEARAALR
ncbi:amylo-alpha-1,6-glucosidase, partial [Micromonospora sp. DR5-3]|uniref:glycogen debranching N-terminal domain-containing protein n=1 Tax=unclassified Micromonospora TaxID=2617518 RepID=UPI0011DC2DAC